jgi:hypothetical protein
MSSPQNSGQMKETNSVHRTSDDAPLQNGRSDQNMEVEVNSAFILGFFYRFNELQINELLIDRMNAISEFS